MDETETTPKPETKTERRSTTMLAWRGVLLVEQLS
jgi:hypothetical protein